MRHSLLKNVSYIVDTSLRTIEIKRKTGELENVAKKGEAETEEIKAGFSVANFLQGTKEELDKVVWPSRQQLLSESAAVLLMVILSALLIYLVDNFFGWASAKVFG